MIECPGCGNGVASLEDPACEACGWRAKKIGSVVSLLSPEYLEDGIKQEYAELYDQIGATDIEQQMVNSAYHRREALRLVGYAGDVVGQDVADIGSGRGVLLDALSGRGAHSLVGIDIALEYLELVAKIPGARAIQADAERLPFRDAFDLVLSSDVMEHVLNLGSYLVSTNRAVRLGGRFIVRVPFRENMMQYAAQLDAPYPFVHLRTYNRQLLTDDLTRAGFVVEKIHLDGRYYMRNKRCWDHPHLSWFHHHWKKIAGTDESVVDSNSTASKLYRRVFLEPVTIVAECRKMAQIEHVAGSSGNYELTQPR